MNDCEVLEPDRLTPELQAELRSSMEQHSQRRLSDDGRAVVTVEGCLRGHIRWIVVSHSIAEREEREVRSFGVIFTPPKGAAPSIGVIYPVSFALPREIALHLRCTLEKLLEDNGLTSLDNSS